MIENIQEGVYGLCARAMPFSVRHLSILGFWYLSGLWNPSPKGFEEHLNRLLLFKTV
jgi:hypothetical protein